MKFDTVIWMIVWCTDAVHKVFNIHEPTYLEVYGHWPPVSFPIRKNKNENKNNIINRLSIVHESTRCASLNKFIVRQHIYTYFLVRLKASVRRGLDRVHWWTDRSSVVRRTAIGIYCVQLLLFDYTLLGARSIHQCAMRKSTPQQTEFVWLFVQNVIHC